MLNNILYERSATLPNIQGHFHRPRINAMLTEALEHPLVTIAAGAGFGKTQAASAFLHQNDMDFIWRRLSSLDNLTIRFWESFVYAVGIQNPALSAMLSFTDFPDSMPSFHEFLRIWVEMTANIENFVLVFDDFHMISEPSIIHFVENILCAQLKNLTVILIGRTAMDLDIRGLYTNNSIYRINEEDLRFTKEETEGYFNTRHILLSANTIENIYTKTEGWISAIYLIGISLKKNGHIKQDALVIAERQIFNLIEMEIYSEYSEEVRWLLVKLACFENIPEDVIKEHLKNNLSLLEEIENKNLFIRFNPVTRTYDIHHLFLEFLLEKQSYLPEDELIDAYYKTACWYHARGNMIDALAYYQKCERFEEIWDIISHYEVAIPVDVADLFMSLIESFTEGFAQKHPLVPVVHARLLLNNGKIEDSKREFLNIINIYEALPDTEENRAVAGEAYLFMGMISLLTFDYRFVEYYKKAHADLPGGSKLIDHRLNFSDGNFMVLIKDSAAGEVKRFVDAIFESMPYGVEAMNGAAYGVKYVTKAEAAYYTCDMIEAESCAYKAIYQAEQNAQYDTVCAAYFVLIRVYLNASNYEKTAECAEKLKEKLGDPQKAVYANKCIFTRDIMHGWYYSRLGAVGKVPEWILRKEKRDQVLLPNNFGRDQFIRAYCLLKSEDYYELSALLEVLEDYYDARGLLLARLEVQIYKSIAAHRLGDISQSMSALRNAYDLAVNNALFMQFIEMGKYMRAVLYTAKHSSENKVPKAWLDEIYTKSITYEKHLNYVIEQYTQTTGSAMRREIQFTKREKEIIRYLCQGITSKEIADSLYISTSTVKKTLNVIYSKLGAVNRTDAARIAMQMELHE